MAGVIVAFIFLCGCLYVELTRKRLSSGSRSNSLHDARRNNALQYIDVIIPDMFQTFLRSSPEVNPHYRAVKLESEKWLSRSASNLHHIPAT